MAARLPIPALDTPGITTDFDRLREAGIAHIANLSSDLWTDYNAHDPGITIMEVLSYAITDLGFRTDFLLRDLLAPARTDPARKQFFTAAEILPVNPVTPNDLRRLLIDIPEIKNAWFFACRESLVCCEYFFAFDDGEIKDLISQFNHIVEKYDLDLDGGEPNSTYDSLQELYTAIPELGGKYRDIVTATLVDMDGGQYRFGVLGPLAGIVFIILAAFEKGVLAFKNSCKLSDLLDQAKQLPLPEDGPFDNLNVAEEFETHKDRFVELFIDWKLAVKESPTPIEGANIMNGLYHILVELQDDVDSENVLVTDDIKEEALRRLHRHRNLGEDFEKLQFIELKEIKIDTVVEIDAGVDQNSIKAQVVFAIQRYLNPPLRFYSLQEMLNRGKRTEEIFQTIPLENGFLDEDELERSKLRRVIYTSDLYQVIMSIPGVKAVKCIDIDFCREEDKIADKDEANDTTLAEAALYNNKWCFDICQKEQYLSDKAYWEANGITTPADKEKNTYATVVNCSQKAILTLDCVDMVIEKEGTRVIVDEVDVKEKLKLIQVLSDQPKVAPERDLPLAKGRYRDLHQYFSIQEDFPLVYRVGQGELRPSATPQRKAQVNQLRVFLNFFDQILANYTASLRHVKDLLAVEQEAEDQVLFFRSLREVIPDFSTYLINFYQVNQALVDTLQADPDYPDEIAILLSDLLHRDPLAETDFLQEVSELLADYWTEALQSIILESALVSDYYEQTMTRLLQGSSRSFALRNEILDHLIARFGETFTDFVLSVVQSQESDACKGPRVALRRDLIGCKTDFLRHIPVLGRDRGKAFDMLAPDCGDPDQFWDSDNVSGLKLRVSKLLCLPPSTATRTKLSCDPELVVGKIVDIDAKSFTWGVAKEVDTIQVKGRTKKPRIQVKKNGRIYLEGVKIYSRSAKAEKDRLQIYDALLDGDRFVEEGDRGQFLVVRQRTGTDFFELVLRNKRGVAIARSPAALAQKEKSKMEDLRNELMDLVFRPSCGDGGFHILEHILLRPFSEDIPLLEKFPIPNERLTEERDNCKPEETKPAATVENGESEACIAKDPYSFWITVIAPSTWRRFPEGSARRFFQQVVRRETPAHIGIRFCWLDPQPLFRFEELYKNWLYDVGRRQSDECQIEESQAALIHFVNELIDIKATSEAG